MSAITGYVDFEKALEKNTEEDFSKAMAVQKHRGPDCTRIKYLSLFDHLTKDCMDEKTQGLIGHNALYVTDVTIQQPIVDSRNGIGLAFDGEIFNLIELKQEYESCNNKKIDSIEDLLLSLYISIGFEGMLKKLNGVFAFAAWNTQTGTVQIASDRYGSKPLYYYYGGLSDNRLIFASEMKGIIQFRNFSKDINIEAYNARLMFARPGSKVLLDRVELVPPGTILSFSRFGMNICKFYDIDDYNRDYNRYNNIDEAIADLDILLENAVKRQMISGKRLGIQLSGGIDSTLLAYYAKKIGAENFSEAVAIVDGKGDLGEEHYIKYVSDKLGLNLYKTILTPDYFMENYEKMVWHNDAPVYRPYFACFKRLGELAKEHADVLFCGEGSDEVAGGYSRFAAGYLFPFMSQIKPNNPKYQSYDSYGRYAAMSAETHTGLLTIGHENMAEKLIQERIELFNSFSGSNLDKHLKFEIIECLPEASLRQDKMTMAASIENRVPLLDNDVVDFIMRLPEDMLVRFVDNSPAKLSSDPFSWIQGKYILKEIVAKYFGRDFAYRKKMIMNIDDVKSVSSMQFRTYFSDVIYPKMRERGIVDANKIKNWYDNVEAISKSEFTMMWRAISTETWCQLFID